MTIKELTDMCCMELSANGYSEDVRNVWYSCGLISESRGCSDRMFSQAWYNALQWYRTVYRRSAEVRDSDKAPRICA